MMPAGLPPEEGGSVRAGGIPINSRCERPTLKPMPAYKIEREPFPEERSDPFFMTTPALSARLDALAGALRRGHALLVDAPGSGRSALLERLVHTAPDGWRVVRPVLPPATDEKAFVRTLLEGLGLTPREPAAAALRDADTLLEMLAGRGVAPVIVVDDAGNLDEGAARQLGYLARRWDPLGARFLVVAEPGPTADLLAGAGGDGLPGDVTAFDMPRFDEGQVGDYLHMCLFRAGLAGDSPFDAALVARVARESGGRIGAVGPIARGMLAEAGVGNAPGPGRGGGTKATGRRWPLAVAAIAGAGILLTLAIPGTSSSLGAVGARRDAPAFQSRIRPLGGLAGREERRGSAPADAPPR